MASGCSSADVTIARVALSAVRPACLEVAEHRRPGRELGRRDRAAKQTFERLAVAGRDAGARRGRGAGRQPAGHDQRRQILAGEQERLHRIAGERDVRRVRPHAAVLGDARHVGVDAERVLDRRAILRPRQARKARLQDARARRGCCHRCRRSLPPPPPPDARWGLPPRRFPHPPTRPGPQSCSDRCCRCRTRAAARRRRPPPGGRARSDAGGPGTSAWAGTRYEPRAPRSGPPESPPRDAGLAA